MVNKRNTLGRGLGSLLNVPESNSGNNFFEEIDIDNIIINKDQPREFFDEEKLKELSLSIKKHGIIQPITVKKLSKNKYQLISGERRYRASKICDIKTIPAFIRRNNDESLLEIAIENIQRENLNSIEIAISYKKLVDELNIKQEELGKRLGKDRTTINNYIRLLKLPPSIQNGIKENKIQMGHARSLITIEKTDIQLKIYQLIIKGKLSVRKTEELVRSLKNEKIIVSDKKKEDNELTKIESSYSFLEQKFRHKVTRTLVKLLFHISQQMI